MAISKTKVKPDPESDTLDRAQRKGTTQRVNETHAVNEFLKDEDNYNAVIDYIFGKTDDNPLEDIREFYK